MAVVGHKSHRVRPTSSQDSKERSSCQTEHAHSLCRRRTIVVAHARSVRRFWNYYAVWLTYRRIWTVLIRGFREDMTKKKPIYWYYSTTPLVYSLQRLSQSTYGVPWPRPTANPSEACTSLENPPIQTAHTLIPKKVSILMFLCVYTSS